MTSKGDNPLAYVGVRATQPPNVVRAEVDPTVNDFRNVEPGDFWLNELTPEMFQLLSVQNGAANWVSLTGGGGVATALIAGSGNQAIIQMGDDAGATFTLFQNLTGASVATLSSLGSMALVDLALQNQVLADQLQVRSGADAFIGTATLSSGTVTVANANITALDRVFLTRSDINGSTALGFLEADVTAGVGFDINSYDAAAALETSDVSIVSYVVIREV